MTRSAERRKKASLKRATKTTVNGLVKVAEQVVPGLSLLTEHVRGIQTEMRERRLEDFLRMVLGTAPTQEERDRFSESLKSVPFYFEAFKKAFEDEELDKTWAYATLFHAFGQSMVAEPDRLLYLRAFREMTRQDLDTLIGLVKEWKADKSPVKWFPDAYGPKWNNFEAKYGNLTQILVKWGFFTRRDGTRAPMPGENFTELCRVLDLQGSAPRQDDAP
jgi:hypothetical protein